MFDCEKWLNDDYMGKPRHERICFLAVANGGFDVNSWGFISHDHGHQRGLEQNDALELMRTTAFMDGLAATGAQIYKCLDQYLQIYLKMVSMLDDDKPIDILASA